MKALILGCPHLAAWPEVCDLMDRAVHKEQRSPWEYPLLACRAVGGPADAALPGAAAIFALVNSIHLIDDLLDEDPQGDYRRVGPGGAANMAAALQTAAVLVVEEAPLPPAVRCAIHGALARMTLDTAVGQRLDTQQLNGEEDYWRVAAAKTPPLFSCALSVGALFGDAEPELADRLGEIGDAIGLLIQVSDDLADAMARPAEPDWQRRTNNLAILYAMTSRHPLRGELVGLLPAVSEDRAALRRAQVILVRSGALAYCAYRMVEQHRRARRCLETLELTDPTPLRELLAGQVRPLRQLLERSGIEPPAELSELEKAS